MAFIPRNDEQIKVGTTPGLNAGTSYFRFDGGGDTPDYRGYQIVITEMTGPRNVLATDLDYNWNYITAEFELLQDGDLFQLGTYYNIHFENPVVPPTPVTPTLFIDWTYFIRDITIPNIDASNAKNAPMLERLNSFILKYVPQCLTSILGYNLYKVLLNESSQRVTDLVYGVEYVDYKGNTQFWQGLVQPPPRISLLANYVYWFFQESAAQQTTGTNTIVPKAEAGRIVSPIFKMTDAWNFFSDETKDMVYFLWSQNKLTPKVYPEFTESQRCFTQGFAAHVNMFDI